jgi:hypothetical protein
LHLLVDDLADAENALVAKGWTPASPFGRAPHLLNGPQCIPHRRLNPPGFAAAGLPAVPIQATPGPTTTVLLSAAGWGVCSLEETRPSSSDGFVPPLAPLVDGLVESLLDLPLTPASEALQSHLGVQLAYLYRHCAVLKTQDFAEDLKLEHRQFHYDALAKPGLGTIPFVKEQRQIRDEIKKGERQPQRNSWYLPPSRSGQP